MKTIGLTVQKQPFFPYKVSFCQHPYLLLEPLHSFLLCYKVFKPNSTLLPFSFRDVESRASQDNVEIHTINTNTGVVFDSKINVFLDTKAKVTSAGEVILWQLIFTNLLIDKEQKNLTVLSLEKYQKLHPTLLIFLPKAY